MRLTPSPAWREAADIAGDCYYDHTVERAAAAGPLNSAETADVVVVGAGVAGLNCALDLALLGFHTVVLEAGRIGSGASGRNGGQVLPGFSCELDVIRKQLGEKSAREAWDLSVEGMSIVRERALSARDICDYRQGWITFAAKPGHVSALRDWHAELGAALGYGQHTEFIDVRDVSQFSTGSGYHAALVDHNAGHLNPLKMMLALARQCAVQGVRVYEHSKAESVHLGKMIRVVTSGGEISSRYVVIAANVFSDTFGILPARRVMSVGNTIIATEPIGAEIAAPMLRDGYCACDTNFMLDYFRMTPDSRMLWGGGSTYLQHASGDRVAMLRRKMVERFPVLKTARIDYAWGGLIDVTASRAPDFGRVDENLFYLRGFSGHGLNVGAIAGRITAEAIHGMPRRFDLFARLKHRAFPPGTWLRRTALSAGTWYYRARDALS
jgi:gamma-glutamylputrescine oxidase